MANIYSSGYNVAKSVLYALRPVRACLFKVTHPTARFRCPLCNYYGPFRTKSAETGLRQHAQCPRCGSLERHRLQLLVVQKLASRFEFSKMRVLHVAPEMAIQKQLKKMFGSYRSTDLCQKGVDFYADLRSLPLGNGSFDVVYASHVLEHIDRDTDAMGEIRRVLSPGGFALLPVPVVGIQTVEYDEPNPHEVMHFRAPGLDYFNKYRALFQSVECFTSDDFPSEFQLYIYEDRSNWPTDRMPLRQASMGERHLDFVPVCFV